MDSSYIQLLTAGRFIVPELLRRRMKSRAYIIFNYEEECYYHIDADAGLQSGRQRTGT